MPLKKVKGKKMGKKCLLRTFLSTMLFVLLFFIMSTQFTYAAPGTEFSIDLAWKIANVINQGPDGVESAVIGVASSIFDTFITGFARLIENFAGLFSSLSEQFLDLAITYSLNGENISKINGITVGWGIFRDLVNLSFIFILLYIGIATIIQATSFQVKKIITNLIIVAILVNFSYFLTSFVIDIGNVFANIVYNALVPDGVGIGKQFMANLKIPEFSGKTETIGTDTIKKFMAVALNSAFLFISAFVFFAGASLFIVRHVTLIILLMLSPLAFAAYILPSTQKHWSKWYGNLIGATFVAPIYLLMLLVVLKISEAKTLVTVPKGSPTATLAIIEGFEVPLLSMPNIFIGYIVIMSLLIASYTLSKQIAGDLSATSSKWAGRVLGHGVGAVGFVGRRTIGMAGRMAGNSEWLKDSAAKKGWAGFGARSAMRLSNVAADASFDARNSKAFKGAAGQVGIAASLGAAGGSGGFNKVESIRMKKREDLAKQLTTGNISGKEREKMDEEIDKVKQSAEYKDKKDRIKDIHKMIKTETDEEARDYYREEINTLEAELITKHEGVRRDYEKRAEVHGDQRKLQYLEHLETTTLGSPKVFQTGLDREAAKKIRKGKTALEKAFEDFQNRQPKPDQNNTPPTPPTPPTPSP